MTTTTPTDGVTDRSTGNAGAAPAPAHRSSGGRWFTTLLLVLAAIAFLFPFYYMVVGALQREPNTGISGAFPDFTQLTFANFTAIDDRIDLGQTLISSGIFTGGVIVCTLLFGVLVGYALARLHFRGRGVVFSMLLLVQVVPFQLLMIPLYVLIARDYGLADSYLGMILPFAINSTAVFIFRQYFLQLPSEIFDAARIDGAGELRTLWSVGLPLVRPAMLTAVLLTFIGPWNEFLWPFLITKQPDKQPLAVALANYISSVAASTANPFGAILAGAVVLAAPAVGLFLLFQRHFVSTDLGSGVKG